MDVSQNNGKSAISFDWAELPSVQSPISSKVNIVLEADDLDLLG
jgi:hypothetical protein